MASVAREGWERRYKARLLPLGKRVLMLKASVFQGWRRINRIRVENTKSAFYKNAELF
jgi:hypothetical protein